MVLLFSACYLKRKRKCCRANSGIPWSWVWLKCMPVSNTMLVLLVLVLEFHTFHHIKAKFADCRCLWRRWSGVEAEYTSGHVGPWALWPTQVLRTQAESPWLGAMHAPESAFLWHCPVPCRNQACFTTGQVRHCCVLLLKVINLKISTTKQSCSVNWVWVWNLVSCVHHHISII